MAKEFNITGTCIPEMHYMVDISLKINALIQLIEKGKYFTINRPRQYGKTTTQFLLEKELEKRNDYFVIRTSFEGIGDAIFIDELSFCKGFLEIISQRINKKNKKLSEYIETAIKSVKNLNEVSKIITTIIEKIEKKIVLIIDEVDKSSNNQLFLSFIGMLRNKYLLRNEGEDSTFHSVILAGVHDVKNLKLKLRPDEEQKFNSPWNIATEFKVDMSFNPQEISTMLVDYINVKKVEMNIPEISNRIYHYTSGYPFLVSRVCKEIDEEILPERDNKNWTISDVDNVVKAITNERNTNFESLTTNLENNVRLSDFIEDLVVGNNIYTYNVLNPTIQIGEMYGMVKNFNNKVVIHNKIYEEIISSYFVSKHSSDKYKFMASEAVRSQFVYTNGKLDFKKILLKFQEVIKEKYSKSDLLKSSEFLENNLRMLFLVFLKPIINGVGFSFKEVETSEEKRLDIVVIYLDEKFIVELKLWRSEKYHKQGILQLKDYMKREGAKKGYMLIMDKNRSKEFITYEEEDITMVWI